MKVKNGELTIVLNKLSSLKGIELDGSVNLAIIDLKVDIGKKLADLNVTIKSAIGSLCSVDDKGVPVTEIEDLQDGNQYVKYKFPDVDSENKCKDLINQINDRDIDLVIPSSGLTREIIAGIKCKTEQTEALLMLTVEPVMAKV